MVEFSELRITPDNRMIIDAFVSNSSFYTNVYIDAVYIDTGDTFINDSGPSSSPIYTYNVPTNQNLKNLRLELESLDLPVSMVTNIFFIYIVTRGTAAADTPCGADNVVTMGTVINLQRFYTGFINQLQDVSCECEVPTSFIDQFLKFKALDLAIRTCHYPKAISYWNKFFRTKPSTIRNRCRCNG